MAVNSIKIYAISRGEQKKAWQYSYQRINCSFVRLVRNFKPYEGFIFCPRLDQKHAQNKAGLCFEVKAQLGVNYPNLKPSWALKHIFPSVFLQPIFPKVQQHHTATKFEQHPVRLALSDALFCRQIFDTVCKIVLSALGVNLYVSSCNRSYIEQVGRNMISSRWYVCDVRNSKAKTS